MHLTGALGNDVLVFENFLVAEILSAFFQLFARNHFYLFSLRIPELVLYTFFLYKQYTSLKCFSKNCISFSEETRNKTHEIKRENYIVSV